MIESIKDSKFKPKWNVSLPIWNIYKKEELYVYGDDKNIISSFILNNEFDNDYSSVKWQINAKPQDITIIHTFAIDSNHRQKENSKRIFEEIRKTAIENNQKTLRIDIVDGNIAA